MATRIKARPGRPTREETARLPPARRTKEAEKHLRKIIEEWDASGRVKTSAYWRLLGQLEEGRS